jgi:hypothetical protein
MGHVGGHTHGWQVIAAVGSHHPWVVVHVGWVRMMTMGQHAIHHRSDRRSAIGSMLAAGHRVRALGIGKLNYEGVFAPRHDRLLVQRLDGRLTGGPRAVLDESAAGVEATAFEDVDGLDFTELGEHLGEVLLGCCLGDLPDKELARGDGLLGGLPHHGAARIGEVDYERLGGHGGGGSEGRRAVEAGDSGLSIAPPQKLYHGTTPTLILRAAYHGDLFDGAKGGKEGQQVGLLLVGGQLTDEKARHARHRLHKRVGGWVGGGVG